MTSVFILKYQLIMLNIVQIKESQNQHMSNVESIVRIPALDKQNECTTDDQYMLVSQSLINNNDLLELDE